MIMPKTTIECEIVREQVDHETGKLVKKDIDRTTKTIHKQEPPFVKLYIADMLYLQDMPKGLTNVVYALLEHAAYASKGLRVYLPSGLKKEIIEQLGIPKQTFSNALVKLCKGEILRRVDTGVYELNPYLFGRGEWKDIDNLRVTWNYDAIKGRTFQGVTISRKDGTSETVTEAREADPGIAEVEAQEEAYWEAQEEAYWEAQEENLSEEQDTED